MSAGGESINIEEIFDLAELEKLLEIVVGYEQRRQIRAQIRIVRKNLSERKSCIDTRTTRSDKIGSSPARKVRDEPSVQTKVTQKTVTVERPEKIVRDDSRVQKSRHHNDHHTPHHRREASRGDANQNEPNHQR